MNIYITSRVYLRKSWELMQHLKPFLNIQILNTITFEVLAITRYLKSTSVSFPSILFLNSQAQVLLKPGFVTKKIKFNCVSARILLLQATQTIPANLAWKEISLRACGSWHIHWGKAEELGLKRDKNEAALGISVVGIDRRSSRCHCWV